eukprot:gene14362-4225_t
MIAFRNKHHDHSCNAWSKEIGHVRACVFELFDINKKKEKKQKKNNWGEEEEGNR